MPGAIAGDGNEEGYSFTIKAPIEEVQNFYETEMTRLGWETFANGQGANNAILMIFSKGESTLSVSILPQADGLMYVLLVK